MFVGQQVALTAHLKIQLVPYAVAQKHNSFETRADWNRERNKMTQCHFKEALDAVHQTFKWNFSKKTYTFSSRGLKSE